MPTSSAASSEDSSVEIESSGTESWAPQVDPGDDEYIDSQEEDEEEEEDDDEEDERMICWTKKRPPFRPTTSTTTASTSHPETSESQSHSADGSAFAPKTNKQSNKESEYVPLKNSFLRIAMHVNKDTALFKALPKATNYRVLGFCMTKEGGLDKLVIQAPARLKRDRQNAPQFELDFWATFALAKNAIDKLTYCSRRVTGFDFSSHIKAQEDQLIACEDFINLLMTSINANRPNFTLFPFQLVDWSSIRPLQDVATVKKTDEEDREEKEMEGDEEQKEENDDEGNSDDDLHSQETSSEVEVRCIQPISLTRRNISVTLPSEVREANGNIHTLKVLRFITAKNGEVAEAVLGMRAKKELFIVPLNTTELRLAEPASLLLTYHRTAWYLNPNASTLLRAYATRLRSKVKKGMPKPSDGISLNADLFKWDAMQDMATLKRKANKRPPSLKASSSSSSNLMEMEVDAPQLPEAIPSIAPIAEEMEAGAPPPLKRRKLTLTRTDAQMVRLKEEVTQLTQENRKLHERIIEYTTKEVGTEAQIRDLEREVEIKEAALGALRGMRGESSLQHQVELDQLQGRLRSQGEFLTNLCQQLTIQQAFSQTLAHQFKVSQIQVTKLQERLSDLQQEVAQKDMMCKALQQTISMQLEPGHSQDVISESSIAQAIPESRFSSTQSSLYASHTTQSPLPPRTEMSGMISSESSGAPQHASDDYFGNMANVGNVVGERQQLSADVFSTPSLSPSKHRSP